MDAAVTGVLSWRDIRWSYKRHVVQKKSLWIYAEGLAPDQSAHMLCVFRELQFTLTRKTTLVYRLTKSVALRSDCRDVQSDLKLQCSHIS